MTSTNESWTRFQRYTLPIDKINLSLDISKVAFQDEDFKNLKEKALKALDFMQAIERGGITNPDENRMVGHYWLRNTELAPSSDLGSVINEALDQIKQFVKKIHSGEIKGALGTFENILIIGIGGSALGPQFVSTALDKPGQDPIKPFFFDNTDPDGMDQVLSHLGNSLGKTLSIVISKSGGTKETRNGMLEAKQAYENAGIDFSKHVVAITSEGSQLDKIAKADGWLDIFPMWDWVGGRTSELSAVGLLPAALQGINIQALLDGAKDCDEITRTLEVESNPAVLLAMMWHHCGSGKGDKAMVILPYKDRLQLFSKYLQQLVMESLGKAKDLDGNLVEQGISVYGNKGSTDQHAYIQQLRDGRNDFFATFIEVLRDRKGASMEVEPSVTSGDYLSGFFLGTRQALSENNRDSITITIDEVSPRTVGILIALYERAVGLYASMININAYHQPGVEAGKKAAGDVINLQVKILDLLKKNAGTQYSVESLDKALGGDQVQETIFKICQHLAANSTRCIRQEGGTSPSTTTFSFKG
jgi:glucose-6-phosphate isomerase